jgi:hypothetical protein
MFDLLDRPKAIIFKASVTGFLIGALAGGGTLGIWQALSESSEARHWTFFAAVIGVQMGAIAGTVVGVVVGVIRFARRRNL